ncbi:hypothetical protein [Nocardiopsis tropica]|jgi:hypothetical protein|uniref:Uncharacterized protein n=1 Tax=Nocardiopsis tropica TaxID=109330 RepID=A0ABU7KW64_9ACTN|nr:hypothetical protein [Nocardiopsis umidischolae]MEE2053550.1 hypothetical protein [Nocardiopsis umidischolae]
MVVNPSPGDNARWPLLEGRAATVFTTLLAVATLMMLWTWTGHTAFAAAGCCTAAVVFAAGFVRARAGWAELVGGPLDGARVRSARADRLPGTCLVLAVPGGGRARYGRDEAGRLVYRGRDDGGES